MSQNAHQETPFVLSRTWAWLLLSTACGAILLSSQDYLTTGAAYGDDNSSHLAWIVHIAHLLRTGHTNFYFGQENLGVPMFLAYQPFSGLMMGGLHALTASWIESWILFKLSIVVLWASMPFVFYKGGRWLGFSRLQACILGLLSLCLQDPYKYGLSLESYVYRGLYSQLYGMFFLPLAMGSIYRYTIRQKGSYAQPIVWFTCTFLSHAFLGLFVGIMSVCMLLAQPRTWRSTSIRLLRIYGITILLLAFWMIPLLQHVGHVGGLPWKTDIQNGWPWQQCIQWFISGRILDNLRAFPWLTGLFFLGLGSLMYRRKETHTKWLLLGLCISMLFFLGRTNWGALYNKVPLHKELNVMRYIVGIQLFCLYIAACGLGYVAQSIIQASSQYWKREHLHTGIMLLCLLSSGALIHSQSQRWKSKLRTFAHQDREVQQTLKRLSRDRTSRYFVHKTLGTSSHFHRDLFSTLSQRPQMLSYGMTFHATLGTYYIPNFDWTTTSARLFNVGTLLRRGPHAPPTIGAYTLNHHSTLYQLYQTKSAKGFFDFARTPFHVHGKPKSIRRFIGRWMLPMFRKGLLFRVHHKTTSTVKEYPCIEISSNQIRFALTAHSTQPITSFKKALQKQRKVSIRSKVLKQSKGLNRYTAHVDVVDPSDILFLKVNAFPYWNVFIDQKKAKWFKVSPNYMGVRLDKGIHQIRFEYTNPGQFKILMLLSLLGLFILSILAYKHRCTEGA